MVNRSDPASGIIPIPQGAGTLDGIGEKFYSDSYSEGRSFPLHALLSGNNAFNPRLSLGNGKDSLELTWAFNVPGATRRPHEQIRRCDDSKYRMTFVMILRSSRYFTRRKCFNMRDMRRGRESNP
jgi:hypothetical protein